MKKIERHGTYDYAKSEKMKNTYIKLGAFTDEDNNEHLGVDVAHKVTSVSKGNWKGRTKRRLGF